MSERGVVSVKVKPVPKSHHHGASVTPIGCSCSTCGSGHGGHHVGHDVFHDRCDRCGQHRSFCRCGFGHHPVQGVHAVDPCFCFPALPAVDPCFCFTPFPGGFGPFGFGTPFLNAGFSGFPFGPFI